MKKIMILGIAALSLSAFAQNNIVEIRAGFSPAPKFDVTPSKKAKASYQIGAEYRYFVTNNTELGVGIAYQNHGKLKSFTDLDSSSLRVDVDEIKLYDSVPIYATVKYNFRNTTEMTPYVKANLGYSINTNKNNSSNYKIYNSTTGALVDSGKLADLKAKNGMYYSLGAGLTYKGFTTDLSYEVNTADIDSTRYDGAKSSGSADNRRITLSFGYQFGF